MKHKRNVLHAFISFFLLQFFLLHALASASNTNSNRKASPLEFFKLFQGTQKGDTIKGINALKKYLHTLGYLSNHNHNHAAAAADGDYFDENLESAVKTYQRNFNLNPTGHMDLKTVSMMGKPRCGVPDVINGTTRMQGGPAHYHTHYVFYPGRPKWPATKQIISCAFLPGTRTDVQEPVRQVF